MSQADARTSAAYNVVLAFETEGAIDEDALRRAWAFVLRRHRLLGARIAVVDFSPRFVIDEERASDVEVSVAACVSECARRESETPLDFERGPLHRVRIARRPDGSDAGIVVTIAHVVFDGPSAAILFGELQQIGDAMVRGEAPRFEAPVAAHDEQVVAELEYLQSDAARQTLAGMTRRLAGASECSSPTLPGRATLAHAAVHDAQATSRTLDREAVHRIRQLAARERTTPAAIYLAAFQIAVWHYSGQARFTVSVPTSTRDAKTAQSVGYLTNLCILQATVNAQRSAAWLIEEASNQLFDLMDEARIPYPTLVRALKASGENPQTLQPQLGFNYQRVVAESYTIAGAHLRAIPVPQRYAKDRLAFDVDEEDDSVRLTLLYGRDAVDPDVAPAMLTHLVALLEHLCRDTSVLVKCIDLSPPARVHAGVSARPDATLFGMDVAPADVLDAFESRAQSTPDALAVTCGAESMTYVELNRCANRLAAALMDKGVGPESRVAVSLPRGTDTVVALLGVWKAGGVHVALDPAAPAERLAAEIADTAPAVYIVQGEDASALPEPARAAVRIVVRQATLHEGPDSNPPRRSVAENAAYCIHTSGSTGRPKAVVISFGALAAHLHGMLAVYDMKASDRVLQFAATHLDPSIEQILSALCAGASLHLRDDSMWSPDELADFIGERRVSVADIPTAYWNHFATRGFERLRELPLRLLIIGGEGAPAHTLPSPPLPFDWINAYGPTETAITATVCRNATSADASSAFVSIGHPVAGTQLYLLNEFLQPVPAGVRGEIYLAGPKLARGYLDRRGLTAQQFLPNPFGEPGSRMYRTGDFGRKCFGGQVQFLGRTDRQVKIRGFRVELGDVEAAVHALEGVRAALVILRVDPTTGTAQLVAYVVAPETSVELLRERVALALPAHMIPSFWVSLDALPSGRNGKVDYTALPAPGAAGPGQRGFVPPRTELEKTIAAIWCDAMRLNDVSVHDNFFALGGHSLLATQIVARLGAKLACKLNLRMLLDAPTIAELSARLASSPATDVTRRLRIAPQPRSASNLSS